MLRRFFSRALAVSGLTAPLLVLVIVLERLNLPTTGRFWRELWNFWHVPVFGLLAMTLLGASRILLKDRLRHRGSHYLLALVASGVLGAASEWLQINSHRDADVLDLLRDLTGAACALGLVASFDRQLVSSARSRLLLRVAVAVLLLLSAAPVLLWYQSQRYLEHNLPAICRFESFWENLIVGGDGAEVSIVPPPETWLRPRGERVARVTFRGLGYPKLTLDEPYPDWRPYDFLEFELYSPATEPRAVILSIFDVFYEQDPADRFDREIVLAPGANRVRIPLDEIRAGPAERELQLASILWVNLWARRPVSEFTIYVDDIVLGND